MKTLIISYSMTGNNAALATSLAKALNTEHVAIAERKSRTMATIVMDVTLRRTPKIVMPQVDVNNYDLVLFIAPVWMGQVATPLRACFSQLAQGITMYAFISICGGADGPNPKLSTELQQRLGREPVCLLDLHIADLLPSEPKPTRDDTSRYQVTEQDISHLRDMVMVELGRVLADRLN